ncbi:MAG: pyruvate synthase subunit PorB [Thermodesulfobacteriota bacterium]
MPAFEPLASGHRACQGCGEILAMRQAIKALDDDIIVISATGCMEVVTSPYPQTAWNVPWLHVAFENAGAVGSGVEAARKAMARKGRLPSNKTKIIITGGDGGTSDIGFQALSGALERFHDFVYLCFDNEAYMNTGIQRSSATPWGCWSTTTPIGSKTTGKATMKKDLPAIVAAHNIPYVATASPAYHLDLMNKVRKAAAIPGPAFVHIFSPCPTGWRMPTQLSVKVARLAVQTKVYPLYEVVNGRYTLTRKSKKFKPVSEYLKIQGRFRHLSDEAIAMIQRQIDEGYMWLEERGINQNH